MLEGKVSMSDVKALLKDAPESGNAEVVLVDPKRTGSITVRDYTLTDEEGNSEYRPFVDSKGNHRVVKYTKKKKLNLSRDNDRLEYMQALLHPIYTQGANPIIKVRNLEAEAEEFISTRDLTAKVNGIIQGLGGEDLNRFARVLLIKIMPGSTPAAVKRAVYEKADLEPLEVLKEWEDPERPLKELIRAGIVKKIISSDTGGRWKVDQVVTGTSFEQTLEWFKENEDLVPKLRKQIYG